MHYTPKHAAPRVVSKTRAKVAGVAAAGGATVAATLATAAPAQAASGNVWDRVAACESGGNWSINTGNGYYGGLQFSVSSWRAAGGARYAAYPHQASRLEQIAVGQNLLRAQGPGAWPVCSKKAGLTRANGLGAAGAVASTPSTSTTASRSTKRSGVVTGQGVLTRSQIRVMQDWLNANKSGRWNRATTRSLQRVVGAHVDGVIGPQTVAKTEKYVGASLTGLRYFNQTSVTKVYTYALAHR